jgi:hypothetical protein
MVKVESGTQKSVQVVVSVGRGDFGRCPIGSTRSAAFWPVAGKTALEHLLSGLVRDGVKSVTICAIREYAETLHDIEKLLSEIKEFQ